MTRVQTTGLNKCGNMSAVGSKPHPKQSLLGKMASNTISMLSSTVSTVVGHTIIGKTPPSVYDRLRKDEAIPFFPGDNFFPPIKDLGRTGDGQVFIVRSKFTGRTFARKVTNPQEVNEHNRSYWDLATGWKKPNEVHVFENSSLKDHPHPRISSILAYDTGEIPGTWILYSSFCAGGNLAEQIDFWCIRRRTEVPHQFLLHILVQSFEALAFLHNGLRHVSCGRYYQDAHHTRIVHGDFKGENIFLNWSSNNVGGMPDLVLGDFGTSLVEGFPGAKVMPGTLMYNAPEVQAIHGFPPITEANVDLFYEAGSAKTCQADVYALGCLIYMIAAKDRFPHPSDRDLSELSISRDYEIPGLKNIIAKCLQVDPAKRATADFDEQNGIMQAVDKFREVRDKKVSENAPLGPTDWLHPQAKQ